MDKYKGLAFETISTQLWVLTVWTGCMLYSEVQLLAFTRYFLSQMTVIHSVLLGSVHRDVLCHYRVSYGRAETSVLVLLDFTAALSGWSIYCDDVVGAASPGIWTRILSGIIVASHALLLLMNLVWGISHFPKLLQCLLRPGVFPRVYMWLPWCGGPEGAIQSGDFPEQ